MPPRICTGCTLAGRVVNNNIAKNNPSSKGPPFYCVKFDDEEEVMPRLARLGSAYARRKQLGWNLSPPRSWSMYSSGPHVTLNHLPDASRLEGRRARVRLGELKHVDTGRSRWIMYEVGVQIESPRRDGGGGGGIFEPVTSCGRYPCHVSVAQERLVGTSRHSRRNRRRRNRTRKRRQYWSGGGETD